MPFFRCLGDALAGQPYLELQLGSQEVALGWWPVLGSAGLQGVEEGERRGGCKTREVPLLQHPWAGGDRERNLHGLCLTLGGGSWKDGGSTILGGRWRLFLSCSLASSFSIR